MDVVVLLVAAALGAAVQRAVGAGYSLVLVPAALVALPDDRAVPCVLAAGIVLSAGLLVADRARFTLRGDDTASEGPVALGAAPLLLLAAAPVGQFAALALLGALRGDLLRVVAAAALLLGCVAAALPPRLRPPAPGRAASLAGGVLIGVVGALTGVFGPFVALFLALCDPRGGDALRHRLWLAIGWLSATALAAAAITGAGDLAGAPLGVALAPALALGAVAGRRAARRLPPHRHRPAVLVLAAAGTAVLLAGL